ncbi:MAG: hypothetical protein JJO35_00350 [Escherichia coli]|nr:hypothetical protein [Escherichia coli]MBL0994533.1 hypothetical protein [Escherichia coli]MBL1009832.1 hypothetical protein [Escherichia coli]
MSAFKDFVAADVQNVFINLDEFAKEHEIGHEVVPCILDKIITQANGDDSYLGVFVNQLTIYVEVGVIETPVEGELLNSTARFILSSLSAMRAACSSL